MKNKKGFTLFELLVVVSIIGVLLGLATVAYSSAQKRARDARRREDMDAIQKSLEQCYALQDGVYPDSAWTSGALACQGTTIMNSFPVDPKNSDEYVYTNDAGQTDADGYCYCALMESAEGNSGADCNYASATKQYYCISQRQ